MAKNKHLDHATHNKNACEYLNSSKEYVDWTVISAFYSALHYVSHKIFPLKTEDDAGNKFKIETVEEYINIKLRNSSTGKHYVLVDLVYEKCDRKMGGKYRRLLELSKAARYTDYNIEQKMADAAISSLAEIQEYCK